MTSELAGDDLVREGVMVEGVVVEELASATLADAAEPTVGGQMVSGVRWSMLDQTVQQVLRLGVNILLARLVGPKSFGLLAMALVVTQISMFIADAGLGPAVVHREQLERRHVDVAFTCTTLLGLLLSVGVALGASGISGFFHEPDLPPVLMALSAIFLLRGAHAVPLDLLRRALRFDLTAVVASAGTIAAAVVGVVAALAGAGVWALVAYALVETGVSCTLAMVLAHRQRLWRPGISLDMAAFRDLAPFGAYVTGARFLGYGVGNFDNLIVGRMLGSIALGYYGLAYRLVLFPLQRVADAVALVGFPALARVQHDRDALRRIYLRAIQSVVLVCMPATIGIAVAAPALVRVIFGERWLPAIATMEILAMAGPTMALTRINGAVLQAAGKPKWDFVLNGIDFVLFLTGFLVGAHYGVAGVAVGFLIARYVGLPGNMLAVTSVIELPVRSLIRVVAPVVGATALLAAAGLGVRFGLPTLAPLAQLVAITAAGAAAYAAAILVLAPGLLQTTVRRFIRR
jgi:PST family polysaccharide transporter